MPSSSSKGDFPHYESVVHGLGLCLILGPGVGCLEIVAKHAVRSPAVNVSRRDIRHLDGGLSLSTKCNTLRRHLSATLEVLFIAFT